MRSRKVNRSRATTKPATTASRSVSWRPLAIVCGVAFAIKLAVLLQLHDHPLLQPRPEVDSGVYWKLAQTVASGDLTAGIGAFFLSPLYIYVLALIVAATQASLVGVGLVQVALGAAAVGLMAALARRWYGKRGLWVAASLAMLTGYLTFSEILTNQSALDPFLTVLGLWTLARAWERGRWLDWLFAGVVLGVHALNRPNIGLWGIAVVTLLCIATLRNRAMRLASIAALVAGLVVPVVPVALRNHAASGQWTLISTQGGLNFYTGNNPDTDGTYHQVAGIAPSLATQAAYGRRVAGAALGHAVSDAEASAWFSARAWAWIGEHPGAAARLLARKLFYTINAAEFPTNDSYAFYRDDESSVLRMLFIGPGLLIPFGLAGIWLGRPSGRWWVWVAFVPIYVLAVAAFLVAGRYRLPLLVACTVPATGTLLAIWDRWRHRQWPALAWALATVTGVVTLSNIPLGLDDGSNAWRAAMVDLDIAEHRDASAESRLARLEPNFPNRSLLLDRTARAYLRRGDAAQAVPLLRRALAVDPARAEVAIDLERALVESHASRAEVLDAIRAIPAPEKLTADMQLTTGRVALDRGDVALAEPFLARAAQLAPQDSAAHEWHGVLLGMTGQAAAAVSELELAVRLDPSSPSAHLNLAVAYATNGRLAEARHEASVAVQLKPDYARARDLLAALDRH